jgi:hypothetical protein
VTFLLSEDKSLREKLQGMTVQDQRATGDGKPRSVGVWFGQPDQEIRDQSYPYITIDMIDVQRDQSREMRGLVSPDYLEGSGSDTIIDMPIPVTIDYQVTSYARHPRHDREIITQLLHTKFPIRFGYLELDDGTRRRLDVMDVSKRDVTEQAKRLFVNAITVRVSSEVVLGTLKTLEQVSAINLNLPAYEPNNRPGDPFYVGVGQSTITE